MYRACLFLAILIGIPASLEMAARRWGPATPESRWIADAYLLIDSPAFVPTGRGQMETHPYLLQADNLRRSFFKAKPPGTARVFFIGDSTTAGWPYLRSSFPDWMREMLHDVAPETPIEIINAGFLGFDSRRLLALAQEILNYSPDIIVFRGGYDDYVTFKLRHGPLVRRETLRLHAWLALHSRFYDLLLERIAAPSETSISRMAEPSGVPDYDRMLAEYEAHVRAFVSLARDAGVRPMLMALPFTNERLGKGDPFTSVVLPGMNAALKRIASEEHVLFIPLSGLKPEDFVDTEHSTIPGYRKIALDATRAFCDDRALFRSPCDWSKMRPEQSYRERLGLLDRTYLSHLDLKLGLYYFEARHERELALSYLMQAEQNATNPRMIYDEMLVNHPSEETIRLLIEADSKLGFKERADRFRALFR